jgi:hypothetical protein
MRRIELQDANQQNEPSPSLRNGAATQNSLSVSKGNLKKQTQFIEALMGAKSLMQRNYNNNPAGRTEENKANPSGLSMSARNCRTDQSQFQDAGSDSAFEFQEKCL